MKTEIWVVLSDWEGYEVSNLGRIRSWRVGGHVGLRAKAPRILKTSAAGSGYRKIMSRTLDGFRHIYVHRAVAICFLENSTAKPVVNHINLDKSDNRVENLEWVTYPENAQHYADLGFRNGENNPGCKHSDETVESVHRLRAIGLTYKAIAERTGMSVMQANRIARGLLRKGVRHASV
jgi:HNH endonuclease/NUMOD4 motif